MTAATYASAVHTFNHAHLAAQPAYTRLRQALSDLANETPPSELAEFLAAVRDMAATAPYGDTCPHCVNGPWWPHAVKREGSHITGTYQCERGHTWPCTWAIAA